MEKKLDMSQLNGYKIWLAQYASEPTYAGKYDMWQHFANGIILQRDASQQALTGKIIKAEDWKEAQLGDLLFWGTKSNALQLSKMNVYRL